MTDPAAPPLVSFEDVSVVFGGRVHALDHVDLTIARGEVLGLVGESGSGKTTLCRTLIGLTPLTTGWIRIGGAPLIETMAADPLGFRRRVQMLLQDAVASLSPRLTIGRTLEEPIAIHGLPREAARRRLDGLLARLGLPRDIVTKFPHQISGGQARRVGVARALMVEPDLIVADEPTAGLDVSVQGELLNLLMDLRRDLGLTYLLVSHNLNVIRRVTDRTAVMYLGQIVETAPTRDLFDRPAHPYAAALVSTNPAIDPKRRRRPIVLGGEIPSVVDLPSGCRFHTRCPVAQARCAVDVPAEREVGPGRRVRCHFPFSLAPTAAADALLVAADAATAAAATP
ncbi:oligopeptide/dipeptide ABC transporter ATP-binding protein [Prosthecomicrobium hirschii]|uniref:oligopeptide/dipeptide ABC transporter ATP-binding protein n=1 Tax=Prosthecodimorpha hirschii TaxID=665126 RepID=UPI00221E4844|nr:ABC transporter ATP-binding protein [Prosthecomicrobium hirschii]MCW1840057.1 ABC transporter ATP-binding protein [Prosthecomicrobium hirschii]